MSYVESVIRRVAEVQNDDWCITIELKTNPNRWVQFTRATVNLAYPFSEEPAVKLGQLGLHIPPALELLDWKPQTYATFKNLEEDAPELGRFVAGYLQRAFGTEDHEAYFAEKSEFL